MNTLVLLSGGMDSTALLSTFASESPGDIVETLSIDYGQRHIKELQAAAAVAAHYGVPHDVIDLSVLAGFLTSALTDQGTEVPDGHYAEDTMRQTVVPNRNAIMLMVAAGIASSRGLDRVATAVHAGDHFIYPDCRPDFIDAASHTAWLGTQGFGDITIVAPFVQMSKTDIAGIGHRYDAPFHLSWSCYKGGRIHCGACGTCYERREAFRDAGVDDPTEYEALPMYATPEGVA